MKHFRLFLSMLMLMCCSIGTMWSAEVTLKYSGTTTKNMTGNNDATTLGGDSKEWSVVGDKGGNTNYPGLNKAGQIRLYGSSSNHNKLTITNLSGVNISSVTINYGASNYDAIVKVGDNAITGIGTANTSKNYTINSTSFTIAHNYSNNTQVYITSIVITTGSTQKTNVLCVLADDAAGMGNIKGLYNETFDTPCTISEFTEGEKVGIWAESTKANEYKFTGWTLNDDADATFDETKGASSNQAILKIGKKDVTATAHFKELHDIVIDDLTEELATIVSKVDGIATKQAVEGEIVTLSLSDAKDGYVLSVWNVWENADENSPVQVENNQFIMPAADVWVSATLVSATPATITLSENGTISNFDDGQTHYTGETITLPMTAGGNCNASVAFVGWSDVDFTQSATQPTANFYAPGASYTILKEETTLYAVYATKKENVIFNETFDKCNGKGGNDDSWNGSIATATLTTDNTGWTYDNENGARQCAKFGTSSKLGSATTPVLDFTGNAVLTFKAGAWNGTGEATTLYLETTNGKLSVSSVEMESGAWTDYVVTITEATESPKITFKGAQASKSRFFLDEVKITKVSYSDYSTTCAEAIEVQTPTFSVQGGEYSEAQSVTISCETAGAVIHYTIDGTEPTSASTKYAGAINVTKSMTIKAIAYVGEYNHSEVATTEYTILQAQTIKLTNKDDEEFAEATIYADGENKAMAAYVDYQSIGKVTVSAEDETLVDISTYLRQEGTTEISLVAKGKAGTTTITVNVAGDDTYISGSATFVLHVIEHKTVVSLSFAAASYEATIGEEFTEPELTVTPSVTPIVYSSSDGNVAKVDAATGEITLVGMGTTTITATYAGDEAHDPTMAQYTLNVTDPNVDILTVDVMNTTGGSYADFTCTGSATGTSYVGNNMKSTDGYIQMNKGTSGVVSTQSKGFLKTVSITFANKSLNHDVDVYANITPYASSADLYDSSKQGVKLTTLLLGSTEGKTVSFAVEYGNYPYVGLRANGGAVYIEQIAIAWTPAEVVRTGLTEGRFGTICLERNVTTAVGASFYEIAYREDMDGEPYKVFFDEVKTLEAGMPYIFVAESEQITVVYGNETAATAGNKNGLYGTFTAIKDGDARTEGNILEGNYLINSDMVRKCLGNCSLPAGRAYIRMKEVTTHQTAPQQGRRRVVLGNAATGTTTGFEGITEDSTIAPQQEGIYDVLGRKLQETTANGFYIVNGKKQVIVK